MGFLERLLGPDGDPNALTAWQTAARAFLLYAYGLAILRVAGHRVLARYTAIDVVVGIALGSVLSRAVNGNAPLVPTLAASAAIVAAHRATAAAVRAVPALSGLLKGRPVRLVERGRILEGNLRRHSIGRHDLEEALRLSGRPADPRGVAEANLERNGWISVVVEDPPRGALRGDVAGPAGPPQDARAEAPPRA